MFRKQITFKLPEGVDLSLRLLEDWFALNGSELFLVGGCVRDMLLGKTPKDYDLCTDATPEEVKAVVDEINAKFDIHRYSIIPTGMKHGTVTIRDNIIEESFECTTYRVDGDYSDGRHPDSVSFTRSLEEDLKRRDFTINSLAYDFVHKEVIMLDESFMHDLDLGIIRCVGDPLKRFDEDALRMLRAIRFAAQLGFSINVDTFNAIEEKASSISWVSKERIRDELTKILMSDNPQMLELLCLTNLEGWVFSSVNGSWKPLSECKECGKGNKYHYTDTFHHTIDVIRGVPKDIVLRWAALFHDLGKPARLTVDENGQEHFYGHEGVSANIATSIMEMLKFSNQDAEDILKLVRYHDTPLYDVSNKKFKIAVNEIGIDLFPKLLALKVADANAHDLKVKREIAIDNISKTKERFIELLTDKPPMSLKDLAVNGEDLIRECGMKGPMVGECLNWLLDDVLGHPKGNTKERLLQRAKSFLKQNKPSKED